MRAALGWTAQFVFIGVVAALALAPRLVAPPTAREIREQLLAELEPVVLANCSLTRVGSDYDGGYLMCADLLDRAEAAYSFGIGPADDWGCEISQTLGVPVHQYDCFSPPHDACASGRSTFHDECVGTRPETIDGRRFDSLPRQIARNGDAGRTLVMKIDVEGAELASVMATPDRVLNRVDQLAMEIHGANRDYLRLIRKLKRTFHLVHLHYNNQACSPRYRPLPAWAYQVLFVNKRIGVVDPARPRATLPHPLDARDYSLGRDCQTPETIEDRR